MGKFIDKIQKMTSDFFTGADGSILDLIQKTWLFIKETITAMNEALKMRQIEKEQERNGE